MHATLGLRPPPPTSATGLSPSIVPHPSGLRLAGGGFTRAVKHHIRTLSPERIRFALSGFRSPLLTGSLLLSPPAGTKMFQFPAFPSQNGTIRVPAVPRPHAPRRRLSQLAMPFVGTQTKPSPVWFRNPAISFWRANARNQRWFLRSPKTNAFGVCSLSIRSYTTFRRKRQNRRRFKVKVSPYPSMRQDTSSEHRILMNVTLFFLFFFKSSAYRP
jgi:hypothetical protein